MTTLQVCVHPWNSARWKAFGIMAGLLAGSVVLYFYDPAGNSAYPSCMLHALTGLHCPGCGTLRALHQLLHGNFFAAMRLNPLLVLTLPFLGYALLCSGVRECFGWGLPGMRLPAKWIWALLVIILAYWVLRNVPAYPFCLLAPSSAT
jgi:hypothetical protein